MFQKGQVVFSKKGRDRGLCFIVVELSNEYLFLADGDLRKLNKPKKKKVMHVQPTNDVLEELQTKLINAEYLLDADIRKALVPYKKVNAK